MWMAYLQAVQGNIYDDGLTVKASDKSLNDSLNMLAAVDALPTHPKPVQTVKSVQQCLCLNPQYITQNTICTICWKVYTADEIKTMNAPRCLVLHCKGIVYDDKKDVDGKIKWVPAKVLPMVSLIVELRKLLMHPGFAESLWDSGEDPINPNDDPDFPMEDIHHGLMWHQAFTNQVREVAHDGSI